jgi:hypothetical protein
MSNTQPPLHVFNLRGRRERLDDSDLDKLSAWIGSLEIKATVHAESLEKAKQELFDQGWGKDIEWEQS